MAIDYRDTIQLMEAVERATPPASFLLDTFFPRIPATAPTAKVEVQYRKAARRLAPFVVRGAKGIDVKRDPIASEVYKPPMMAPRRVLVIYKILSKKYKVLATEGNFNNEIGLPLTILKLKDEECLVLEMGMNHFKEMHDLSNIAKPNVAVITNIGTSHIGNLGSRENILKAKLEILDGMVDGTLIINNDNDLLRTVKYDNLITVGIDKKSDYMVHDLKEGVFSSEFYIIRIMKIR